MRLFEMTGQFNDTKSVETYVQDNCQPYLRASGGGRLFRGVDFKTEFAQIISPHKDRIPASMPLPIHKVLVSAFHKAGFIANRNNGLFCTGSRSQGRTYSATDEDPYVIFPVGEFDFTWSPNIHDLYSTARMVEWFKDGILSYDPKQVPLNGLRGWQAISSIKKACGIYADKADKLLQLSLNNPQKNYTMDNLIISMSKMPDFDRQAFMAETGFYASIANFGEGNYTEVIDVKMTEWVTQNYTSENLQRAMASNNEVILKCEKAIVVPEYIVDQFGDAQ